MRSSAIEQYSTSNAARPQGLRKELFITGAIDNIDHNPTSTTSLSAFDGKGISLFQLFAVPCDSEMQHVLYYEDTVQQLPMSYTSI